MAGGAFASRKRVRVENDTGEWIEIKAKLSANDQRILQDEAFSLDISNKDARALMGTAAFAMMRLAFVDWHLLEDGNPVPFSEEALRDIDPDYPLVDEALTRIAELNPTLWSSGAMSDTKTSEKPTS